MCQFQKKKALFTDSILREGFGCNLVLFFFATIDSLRGLSQITFALRVVRWSEKRVVYYIKSAN